MVNGFFQDGEGDKSLTRLLMSIQFVLDWIIIILCIIWQKDIQNNALQLLNAMNFIFGGVGLVKGGAENLDILQKTKKVV